MGDDDLGIMVSQQLEDSLLVPSTASSEATSLTEGEPNPPLMICVSHMDSNHNLHLVITVLDDEVLSQQDQDELVVIGPKTSAIPAQDPMTWPLKLGQMLVIYPVVLTVVVITPRRTSTWVCVVAPWCLWTPRRLQVLQGSCSSKTRSPKLV